MSLALFHDFHLKTLQQGQQGEVEVVGAEKLRGADGFFAEMRASNTSNAELVSLFEAGKNASMKGGTDQVRGLCVAYALPYFR